MYTTLGFAGWANAAVPGKDRAETQELNASATSIPLPDVEYRVKP
ncbi:hypothetical protein [Microvirga sp. P5_D2]